MTNADLLKQVQGVKSIAQALEQQLASSDLDAEVLFQMESLRPIVFSLLELASSFCKVDVGNV